MKKLNKWLMTSFLTSRWYKPVYLYHQHLIPYLPTKQLSTMWASIIKTLKNWETVKKKYKHPYSLEGIWAYALLVEAELTTRGRTPNKEYLKTTFLGGNLCSSYFNYRILYRNYIDSALKRKVIFLDHNLNYLESGLNKLMGKLVVPHNYEHNWISWSIDYEQGRFKHILCNGDYYGILKTSTKYHIGDPDFLKT